MQQRGLQAGKTFHSIRSEDFHAQAPQTCSGCCSAAFPGRTRSNFCFLVLFKGTFEWCKGSKKAGRGKSQRFLLQRICYNWTEKKTDLGKISAGTKPFLPSPHALKIATWGVPVPVSLPGLRHLLWQHGVLVARTPKLSPGQSFGGLCPLAWLRKAIRAITARFPASMAPVFPVSSKAFLISTGSRRQSIPREVTGPLVPVPGPPIPRHIHCKMQEHPLLLLLCLTGLFFKFPCFPRNQRWDSPSPTRMRTRVTHHPLSSPMMLLTSALKFFRRTGGIFN